MQLIGVACVRASFKIAYCVRAGLDGRLTAVASASALLETQPIRRGERVNSSKAGYGTVQIYTRNLNTGNASLIRCNSAGYELTEAVERWTTTTGFTRRVLRPATPNPSMLRREPTTTSRCFTVLLSRVCAAAAADFLIFAMRLRLLLALVAQAAAASISRGASPSTRAALSAEGGAAVEAFVCDGDKKHPIALFNDDFCDCADGTDEPGTRPAAIAHASIVFSSFLPTPRPPPQALQPAPTADFIAATWATRPPPSSRPE